MTTVQLRRLAAVNPAVPEFDLLDSGARVTFLPLETCWPDGRADTSRRAAKSEVATGYTRFRRGDIIVPKITPTFEAGRVFVADVETEVGAATTEVHIIRAHPNVSARFLSYVCRTQPFLQEGAKSLQGVGNLRRVTGDYIASFPVRMYTEREQLAIVEDLDHETAKIDTLIAKQEALLASLAERRQATVIEKVTRGIDPTAELAPTSLDWAEEIPAHWQALNIRRVADMKTGHTPSRTVESYWQDTTIPWFTLADVWQLRDGTRTYLGETTNKISELGLANSAAERLPANTVVLSRTASVGFSGIMPVAMATSQDFWNWVCGPRMLPEYLMHTFRAMRDHLLSLMIGSTHKTIYQPIAAALRVPLPPLDEQRAIVDRIVLELSAIDTLASKAQRVIALLKERRAALITAAVTGDVSPRA